MKRSSWRTVWTGWLQILLTTSLITPEVFSSVCYHHANKVLPQTSDFLICWEFFCLLISDLAGTGPTHHRHSQRSQRQREVPLHSGKVLWPALQQWPGMSARCISVPFKLWRVIDVVHLFLVLIEAFLRGSVALCLRCKVLKTCLVCSQLSVKEDDFS